MDKGDSFSIEATLGIIMSFMTPYPWHVDCAIIAGLWLVGSAVSHIYRARQERVW